MKTKILFLLISFALLINELLLAQPPGLPGTPDQTPVDGGIALLAVAGGVYAYKKLQLITKHQLP